MMSVVTASLAQNETAPGQPSDTTKEITVHGKLMTYDEALPVLTKNLRDEKIDVRIEAASALQWYGETLRGTEALEHLISVLQSKEDYSAIDKKMAAGLKDPTVSEVSFTKAEERLLRVATLKGEALIAAVMSGDKRAVRIMNEMLASASLTERETAQQAKERYAIGNGGGWRRGKRPPATAESRFPVGTESVTIGNFRKRAATALESKRKQDVKNVLIGVRQGAYSVLLKDASGVGLMTKLLVETTALAKEDKEIREIRSTAMRNALMFIEQLPPDEREIVESFVAASASDTDDDIAKLGAVLLHAGNK